MSSPTEICPACNQPVRPPLPYCQCGHLELSHDINPKGKRTACFHFGPPGRRCACRSYQQGEPRGA